MIDKKESMNTTSNITIIGAGLGGLTLARILQLNKVDFNLYDMDASADARPQGGSLDLKIESGQRAIRAANLYNEWKALTHSSGETVKIVDKFGNVEYQEPENSTNQDYNPEIERGQLRSLLLNSLTNNTVRWDHKLISVKKDESNTSFPYLCTFHNGTQVASKHVIGADGAWSQVRKLLSSQLPEYTGICFYDMTIRDFSSQAQSVRDLANTGMVCILGDNKGVIAQRNADDKVRIYAAISVSESAFPSLPKGENQISTLIKEYFDDWHEHVKDLLTSCNPTEIVFRPIYALPTGYKWTHMPNVTLLGDAAHVMSPFAGEGANLAMMDAADLAELIVKCNTFEAAIQQYEAKMYRRGATAAEESAYNLNLFFGDNAIVDVGNLFKAHSSVFSFLSFLCKRFCCKWRAR